MRARGGRPGIRTGRRSPVEWMGSPQIHTCRTLPAAPCADWRSAKVSWWDVPRNGRDREIRAEGDSDRRTDDVMPVRGDGSRRASPKCSR